ncbi:exodeoxyribonuclease VII large subunit [Candidatus Acetothermia bacterium]|nr:exodeoxyribonuclease VII large subunit [Candidatus Acetothermia bacterium]
MEEKRVYTVSQLNQDARQLLESNFGALWLEGEISNLRRAPSGHLYFTLKDESSEIAVVKFGGNRAFSSPIKAGLSVLAYGYLTIYHPRGRYQFIASLIKPAGVGQLQLQFEQLKAKLHKEGLFAPELKAKLPVLPRRIGVITSSTGAAVRDVISILSRRAPIVDIFLFETSVQGEEAIDQIIAALDAAQRFSATTMPLDLLILTRGGGSLEDLAPFNSEPVARAIFASTIPIIAAIGHEIDFTIADFVADLRAPTPSAAAELAVPDQHALRDRLSQLTAMLNRTITDHLTRRYKTLDDNLHRYIFRFPLRKIYDEQQRLDLLGDRISRALRERLRRHAQKREQLEEVLRIADPYGPLRRGYSLTFRVGSNKPLISADEISPGEHITTQLYKGRLTAQIEEVLNNSYTER